MVAKKGVMEVPYHAERDRGNNIPRNLIHLLHPQPKLRTFVRLDAMSVRL